MKNEKLKNFLNKAKAALPGLAGDIASVAMSPNPLGAAIGVIRGRLAEQSETNEEAKKLLNEFDLKMKEFEIEQEKIEAEDRASARSREVEMAKVGGTDWLMYLTGIVGLASFVTIILAVIFIPEMKDNDLFIHLMGMIEGVVISNLFAYYFGTSKSSADKNKLIK